MAAVFLAVAAAQTVRLQPPMVSALMVAMVVIEARLEHNPVELVVGQLPPTAMAQTALRVVLSSQFIEVNHENIC